MATLFNCCCCIAFIVIVPCIILSCGDDYVRPVFNNESKGKDTVCFIVVDGKTGNPIDSATLDFVVIKKVKVISDWTGELVDGSLTEYIKGLTNMEGERCFSYDQTYVPYTLRVFKKGYNKYIYTNGLWEYNEGTESLYFPLPTSIRLEPQ